jgi:hypothetical protein
MQPEQTNPGSEAARMAVFAALVTIQDRGVPVATSRQKVAETFGVSPELVAQVEREGLDKQWPPL